MVSETQWLNSLAPSIAYLIDLITDCYHVTKFGILRLSQYVSKGSDKLKIIVLMVAAVIFSCVSAAQSQCEIEKQRADKWNQILKYKVSEMARAQHRKAKKEFLECLRKPVEAETKTSLPIPSDDKKPSSIPPKYVPKRHKQTNHVTVSDYANFKGKKKQAWYEYFQESQECLVNSNNMKIFVACAKIRKQHLKQFNARWNDQTEELMPLLDRN